MAPPKGSTMSLAAFQQDGAGGDHVVDPDELPSGPTGISSGTVRKKWIAEWDGAAGQVVKGDAALPNGSAPVTAEAVKASCDLLLREYITGGDLAEAVRCVQELGAPALHYQVLKRSVTLAMDKEAREREMVAVLLATLHARGVLTSWQVTDGFKSLLDGLDDLLLDAPEAKTLLSHFMADAHLDGILPLAPLALWPAELAADGGSPAALEVLTLVRARLSGRVPVGGSQHEKAKVRGEMKGVIKEYLSSHDEREVARRVEDLGVPTDLQHELLRAAVECALERGDRERELVSQLLSSLYPQWLVPEEVSRGFEQLLQRVDDLAIDNPHAVAHLAAFMVRAVADDILPPAFVSTPPAEALGTPLQLETLAAARATLSASHFGERRRHVWGPAADASLDDLKRAISALISEYFVSGELNEAVACVRELEAPLYHHEVIKRLVVLSMDGGAKEAERAEQLTVRLASEQLLTPAMLAQGCTRLLEAVPDLRLDHPRAPHLLAAYLEKCVAAAGLPSDEWAASAAKLRSP